MTEEANVEVRFRASREVMNQLSDWSKPVQVRIVSWSPDWWELEVRDPLPSESETGSGLDVPGRIHLLQPFRWRMACGRKVGEHWGSALNIEAVNCPDCLAAPGPVETVAEAVRKAERATSGNIAMMIEAGIQAAMSSKLDGTVTKIRERASA